MDQVNIISSSVQIGQSEPVVVSQSYPELVDSVTSSSYDEDYFSEVDRSMTIPEIESEIQKCETDEKQIYEDMELLRKQEEVRTRDENATELMSHIFSDTKIVYFLMAGWTGDRNPAKHIRVDVFPEDTISSLADFLQYKLAVILSNYKNFPYFKKYAQDYIFEYKGKILEENKTMSEYGIENNDFINVRLKLNGGGKKGNPKVKIKDEIKNATQTMERVNRKVNHPKGPKMTRNPMHPKPKRKYPKLTKKEKAAARELAKQGIVPPPFEGTGAYVQNLSRGQQGYMNGSGGYFSDLLGGVGRTIGGIGDGVGSLISTVTGSGPLTMSNNFASVKTNSLINGGSGGTIRFKPRHLSKADAEVGNRILQGEQRIGYLTASSSFQTTTFRVNLGNHELFPTDFLENDKYEEYKWHGCILEYRSLANTLSTNLTDGEVWGVGKYNVEDEDFVSVEQISNAFGKAGGSIKANLLVGLECASNETNNPVKNTIKDKTVITNDNYNQFYLCDFVFAVTGVPSEFQGQNIGEIYIHYDIDLYKKKQPMNYLQEDTLIQKWVTTPGNNAVFTTPNGIEYHGGNVTVPTIAHYSTSPLKLVQFDGDSNVIIFNYPGRYKYHYYMYGTYPVVTAGDLIEAKAVNGIDAPPDGCQLVDTAPGGFVPGSWIDDITGGNNKNFYSISAGSGDCSAGMNMYNQGCTIDIPVSLGSLKISGIGAWTAATGSAAPLTIIKITKCPGVTPSLDGLPEVDTSAMSLRETTQDVKDMKKDWLEMKSFVHQILQQPTINKTEEENKQEQELKELKQQVKALLQYGAFLQTPSAKPQPLVVGDNTLPVPDIEDCNRLITGNINTIGANVPQLASVVNQVGKPSWFTTISSTRASSTK